jgi:uncharacterized repeat protein (TIGR03803 family)
MNTNRPAQDSSSIRSLVLILFALVLSLAMSARAQTDTVLFNFGNGNGADPVSAVVFDGAGNLYGTTAQGGMYDCPSNESGCGVVFEISPSDSGWVETVLYSFTGGADGAAPEAGLAWDASGNLYGTTRAGGDLTACLTIGCGVVFELSPSSTGWQETVLHTFTGAADGGYPQASVIFDANGNLYGTTVAGGNGVGSCTIYNVPGCGVVFELSPSSNGWGETVVHEFSGGNDGAAPKAGLTFNSAGDLFGTAAGGGTSLGGVVFEMKPGLGGWKFGVIHDFTGKVDGQNPEAGVIFDPEGNLFGTAAEGGTGLSGTAFEMSPESGGHWHFSVLHAFTGHRDGGLPLAGLLRNPAGDLYGTTLFGGVASECYYGGCGVVFKLTRRGGVWDETVPHTFTSNGTDGTNSYAGLIFDTSGNLYGTTIGGGTTLAGTVFEVAP